MTCLHNHRAQVFRLNKLLISNDFLCLTLQALVLQKGRFSRPTTSFVLCSPNNQAARQEQTLWNASMSPHPYSLCILSNIVKKCYSCGVDFADSYRASPYNIIVKHVDRRLMRRDEQSGRIVFSPDYSNTYYHPTFSHLAKKNPLLSGVVNVCRSLWERLSEE